MYSIDGMELGMVSIVFSLYIVGKVWMYYNTNDRESKPKNKRVIKRGKEWD